MVRTAQECHSEHEHNQIFGPLAKSRCIQIPELGNDELEITYRNHYWTYLSCEGPGLDIAHHDSIVVAVKGACRGNGKANARGAIGVFFHEDNHLNRAIALPDAYTSQRADLHAALRALRIALKIRTKNKAPVLFPRGPYRRLRRVIVQTNSAYLVDGILEHVPRWKKNGYRSAKGQPVVNEDLFRQLDAVIERLEEEKVAVQFNEIFKEDSAVAYDLANAALDGISKYDVMGGLRLEKVRKEDSRVLAKMMQDMEKMTLVEKEDRATGGVALTAVAL